MSIKELIIQSVESLGENELQEVSEYLSFLKFRTRRHRESSLKSRQLAELYMEYSGNDRQLAEEGMEDYAIGLVKEDTQ